MAEDPLRQSSRQAAQVSQGKQASLRQQGQMAMQGIPAILEQFMAVKMANTRRAAQEVLTQKYLMEMGMMREELELRQQQAQTRMIEAQTRKELLGLQEDKLKRERDRDILQYQPIIEDEKGRPYRMSGDQKSYLPPDEMLDYEASKRQRRSAGIGVSSGGGSQGRALTTIARDKEAPTGLRSVAGKVGYRDEIERVLSDPRSMPMVEQQLQSWLSAAPLFGPPTPEQIHYAMRVLYEPGFVKPGERQALIDAVFGSGPAQPGEQEGPMTFEQAMQAGR